ncbi:MAG: lytic transglycosylase domain-containing protein [Hyphomicrobiaceae bacterium]
MAKGYASRALGALVLVVAVALPMGGAYAQRCGNTSAGFESWLQKFEATAIREGISRRTIQSAFAHVNYEHKVIRLDRGQRSFKLSFEKFYARRVSNSMIRRAKRVIRERQSMFNRIERRYGVPPSILTAIWGLETNFGGDTGGRFYIIGSLATLAYDCRRSDFFRKELINALAIIDKGDIPASRMRGGWAGEIGPMQFLPSSYNKYAVDFDGDRHRDLFRSVPDMMASTANYFKQKGWRAGQPWGEGTHNYNVIREWNKAEVYVKTIAIMAQKIEH